MITVYTDGSSCGRILGPGGVGCVFIKNNKIIKQYSKGYPVATNNQMEVMAAIKAVKYLLYKGQEKARIISDSQYVIKGITIWIHSWRRNGWNSASGTVKNKEYWTLLYALTREIEIDWEWVRGHDGNEYNELADKLAKAGKEQFMKR